MSEKSATFRDCALILHRQMRWCLGDTLNQVAELRWNRDGQIIGRIRGPRGLRGRRGKYLLKKLAANPRRESHRSAAGHLRSHFRKNAFDLPHAVRVERSPTQEL